jgi:26S proteasome regulatory subunit N1
MASKKEQETIAIKVQSSDKKKGADDEPTIGQEETKSDIKTKTTDEMSAEDLALQEALALSVERTADPEAGVVALALELMRKEIKSATSSMTSVPKPLKFLRPHFETLIQTFDAMVDGDNKSALADILSVLAMTFSKAGSRESLKYKMQGNSTDLGAWGHEYVRAIAGEIGQESQARAENDAFGTNPDLLAMVQVIVPFHLQHNAEHEAVDLLLEVEQLSLLLEESAIDDKNYKRVCLYLLRTADYASDEEERLSVHNVSYHIFKRQNQYVDALRVALRLCDNTRVAECFTLCKDVQMRRQMAYLMGTHKHFSLVFVEEDDDDEDDREEGITYVPLDSDEVDELNEMVANMHMQEAFAFLARELDVEEAKTPEDIYKSHLSEDGGFRRKKNATSTGPQVESARANLASSFVNGLVNTGYGTDKLMTVEDSQWVYKNKAEGKISAVASLGLIMLWNIDEGLTAIDRFLYATDESKAGALLAIGIVNSGTRDESEAAFGLLPDYTNEDKPTNSEADRAAAVLGIGIAYASNPQTKILDLLVERIENDSSFKVACHAALALGIVFTGTSNMRACQAIMEKLSDSEEADLDKPTSALLCIALGLLFLGRGENADAVMQTVSTVVEHKISKFANIVIKGCAYTNSGNVLEVQQMLHECAEHLEDAPHQAAAVLGISLICLLEPVGREMALRTMDHLLQYGEVAVKRGIPIAVAMLHISDPDYSVIDILSKLTHDHDAGVAMSAIFSLGLVGAGTNNSRVAQLLRQLSSFYEKEADHLYCVRLAQGLLHLGKGLVTLSPMHSDRMLSSPTALAGLLTVAFLGLDIQNTLCHHELGYMLYTVVCAMRPRSLCTLDEEGNQIKTGVRVGEAVETVGQAGKPKTISGFQTHTSPVLMGVNDRAELASEEYIAATNVLEGFAILKKNPDYDKQEAERKAAGKKKRSKRRGAKK